MEGNDTDLIENKNHIFRSRKDILVKQCAMWKSNDTQVLKSDDAAERYMLN